MSDWVIDVGEQDFEREVLARSETVPVVVDFWAPWCGPCRVLGPLLERLAEEHAGAFVLARVDVDQAPELARSFGVRSIPAVKAIRARTLVAEFAGAQPEAAVRQILAAVLPSEADHAAREGDEAAAGGHLARARARWEAALALDPRHPGALLGLARLRADAGEADAALDLLERIGAGTPVSEEAERLAASLRTRAAAGGDEGALRRRLEADPGDLDARLDLGRLLAAGGRHGEALEELLEVVRRDPHHDDDAARRAMVDLFAVLGPEHPLTERYRAALARALFR
jgi:putative thioredoxin